MLGLLKEKRQFKAKITNKLIKTKKLSIPYQLFMIVGEVTEY